MEAIPLRWDLKKKFFFVTIIWLIRVHGQLMALKMDMDAHMVFFKFLVGLGAS